MKFKEASAKDVKYVFQTYRRNPMMLVRGRGPYVYDSEGRRYLDFLCGLAVTSIGHAHPRVSAAVSEQIRTLAHVSNLYLTEPMLLLAEKLCGLSGMEKVFFANSGAEANEAAIKLARKYASAVLNEPDKKEIITLENSFHGRTIATVTATGQKVYQAGFEPLLPGIKYARLNDIASVEKLVSKKTLAIMVEPVQGEGGVYPATKEFMRGLARLRKSNNLLLIFDEVQCGLGRTGKWFAFQHYGVKPDIITLAKPLGGGLPLGAMLASGKVAKAFTAGAHASTFGANPVACAAGNALLGVMEEESLVAAAGEMGGYIMAGARKIGQSTGRVKQVRGMGLMIGIEIDGDAKAAVQFFRENGLLANAVKDNVIRILPPLNIKKRHADVFLKLLEKYLGQ